VKRYSPETALKITKISLEVFQVMWHSAFNSGMYIIKKVPDMPPGLLKINQMSDIFDYLSGVG
jgi:hypothetical protein